jgi:flagellar assembly protein FliH
MVAPATPKEQLTAYQRWELASFDEVSSNERVRREREQAEENERTVSNILKQVRQEAYENGLKAGYRDGLTKAQNQLDVERAQLVQIAASFQEALSMQDVSLADSVLTLALELSKAMLKTKLQADPQAIIPVVLDAIQYLPQVKQPARVIVHYEDAKILRANIGEQLKEQGWQLVEDSQIERGGCLVETAENQIDATNEMRWKRLVQGLSRYDDWNKPVILNE